MCAQREAEHGRMYRSGRFCTLSTAQEYPQPHEALKAAQVQIDSVSLVIVVLDRKPLSLLMYPLQPVDKRVVELDGSRYRNIVGVFEANRLQQLLPDVASDCDRHPLPPPQGLPVCTGPS